MEPSASAPSCKFYVHLEGTNLTFVAFRERYTSVQALLDDTAARWAQAEGASSSLRQPLGASVGGRALTSLEQIRPKNDVMVRSSPVSTTDKSQTESSGSHSAEVLAREGNELLVNGDYARAVERYSQALTALPSDATLHCNRALAWLKLESWKNAESDAQRASELDPSNVKARFRWAQSLLGQGKHSEAHTVLSAALDIDSISAQQALEVGLLLQKCEQAGVQPGADVSAPDVTAARSIRLPVAVYLRLKPFYAAAQLAMEESRWAQAITIYRKILELHPTDYASLLGLGTCLLRNKSNHYGEACRALTLLCKTHGHGCFEGWRLLGEAQHGLGLYAEALESYGEAAKYADSAEDVTAPEQRLLFQTLRTKDLKVMAAKALIGQNKSDVALHFISQVLLVDDNYVPALLVYGDLMIDYRAAYDEAVKVAVKALTLSSKERACKRLFCRAASLPGAVPIVLELLGPSMPASGFAYLASTAKEYSAIPCAIALFQQAMNKDIRNPSHVLSALHAMELEGEYAGALQLAQRWLENNPDVSCGPPAARKISARDVLAVLDKEVPESSESVCGQLIFEPRASLGKPDWAQQDELDFMALCFTLVKVLYVHGQLDRIPPLVTLVETVRNGWDFHLTSIRNEQAYYCCAAQCVEVQVPRRQAPSGGPTLYVLGDSHTLPCAWQRIRGGSTLLQPLLVTGCKMWHLREEGNFFPKYNFEKAIQSVPNGSEIMFLLGEIDCREGLLVCVEKGRYASLEEGVLVVVKLFLGVLDKWQKRKGFSRVYIHPVVPVLDATRHIVEVFNPIYRQHVAQVSWLTWLDIYDSLVEERDPRLVTDCVSRSQLRADFKLDGTHLNPIYVQRCLAPALAK
jgi:tetratricopeptide (TPR) repeat protein